VTVAVGGEPDEAVTVAATVTEADHEPTDVDPSDVVPEVRTCGDGVAGGVRSGPPPPDSARAEGDGNRRPGLTGYPDGRG
jgi:hypothetical protein